MNINDIIILGQHKSHKCQQRDLKICDRNHWNRHTHTQRDSTCCFWTVHCWISQFPCLWMNITQGISYSWNFVANLLPKRVAFGELVMTTSVAVHDELLFHPKPWFNWKWAKIAKETILVDGTLFCFHDCIGGRLCLIKPWTQPWW